MRQLTIPLLLAAATTLASCGGGGGDSNPKFTAAVIGDVPYGTNPTDTTQLQLLPALVKSINDDPDVTLAVHDGDIHSGQEYCTQPYDQSVYEIFKTLVDPFVYTPGDNEWTDCHKATEGGGTWNATTGTATFVTDASGKPVDYANGNPVDNLALVRSIFFPTPGKTIGGAMDVHTQAKEFDPAFPTDAQYVENVWFIKSGVLFVTLNIPGGSNNDTDPWYGAPTQSAAQTQEVSNRTGATQRWLKTAFDQAVAANASAVVIVEQANLWAGSSPSSVSGLKPYVDIIAARTASFGKPVLLFNGDSHVYRSDNPLQQGAPCVYEPSSGATAVACTSDAYNLQPYGYNVANFHRVQTHGSTLPLEWLKLTYDPASSAAASATAFGPFSWQRTMLR